MILTFKSFNKNMIRNIMNFSSLLIWTRIIYSNSYQEMIKKYIKIIYNKQGIK
jgi:hypothetical protein